MMNDFYDVDSGHFAIIVSEIFCTTPLVGTGTNADERNLFIGFFH